MDRREMLKESFSRLINTFSAAFRVTVDVFEISKLEDEVTHRKRPACFPAGTKAVKNEANSKPIKKEE